MYQEANTGLDAGGGRGGGAITLRLKKRIAPTIAKANARRGEDSVAAGSMLAQGGCRSTRRRRGFSRDSGGAAGGTALMLIGARWQARVAHSALQPVKPARTPDDTGLWAFFSVSGEAQRSVAR